MQELYRRRGTLTYLLAYVCAQAFNWTNLVSANQRRQANKAVLFKKEASLPLPGGTAFAACLQLD